MRFDIIKYFLCFFIIICCCENDGNMVTKKYFFCGGIEFEEQEAARKINSILPAEGYDSSSVIICVLSGETAAGAIGRLVWINRLSAGAFWKRGSGGAFVEKLL